MMRTSSRSSLGLCAVLALLLAGLAAAGPAAAQEYSLFDRFSLGLGGRFSAVDFGVEETDFRGSAKLDIVRFGAFVKGRW